LFPFTDLLTYDEKNPLIFTQSHFWLFFAVVLIVFQFTYAKVRVRNLFLLGFSLFFYYKAGGYFFLLLLFSTVVDYTLGQKIYEATRQGRKKLYVTLSLVINLGVLAYFKYAYFFTDVFNQLFGTAFRARNIMAFWANEFTGSQFDIASIILPVGISFYTFQTISYSIDIYRGRIKPVGNILDFAFYVSFFPQLVAGPIVRASEFVPQIYAPYRLNREEFTHAIFLIINGLIKKMLISDYISANFVDRVFENPLSYTGFENLMAAYGYAIQIYCDFSGYTDIAIGIALLLGFRLTINFRSPYIATDITDFWRRWHISLSSWLRDYLYISLGGNRQGKIRTYINLMITMLLGGLWHGAHLKFIIWGALHGGALAFHKYWMELAGTQGRKSRGWNRFFSQFITFHFVVFCWLFFRADTLATVGQMLTRIGTQFQAHLIPEVLYSYPAVFGIMLFAYLLHWTPKGLKEYAEEYFGYVPDLAKAAVIVVIILGLYQVKTSAIQPFIYFQF
jgi:alginate O-acetyltransferase complex protein AlgI